MSRELELRTYTLADEEHADRYAAVHWPRHVTSLAALGISTVGVWRETGAPRVIAVVAYPEGADVAAVTESFMASEAFRADMEGFPMEAIREVTVTRLHSVPVPVPVPVQP